jgi:2-polyprenyl-6-hydroxyphenyl methylase/3-demethylubiquinone-9 3-methyltransferase
VLDRHAVGAQSAIDLGCGSGVFTFYLADKGLRVVGIDAADRMIELCREEGRKRALQTVQFIKSELPKLPNVELEKADLIISSSVLEYVGNLHETFSVIRNLLASNGTLIVSFPNSCSIHRWNVRLMFAIFRRPKYYRYVKNVLSRESLARMLEEHGLRIQEVKYYAHRSMLLKVCKMLRFPEKYTENLFVAVVKGNDVPSNK